MPITKTEKQNIKSQFIAVLKISALDDFLNSKNINIDIVKKNFKFITDSLINKEESQTDYVEIINIILDPKKLGSAVGDKNIKEVQVILLNTLNEFIIASGIAQMLDVSAIDLLNYDHELIYDVLINNKKIPDEISKKYASNNITTGQASNNITTGQASNILRGKHSDVEIALYRPYIKKIEAQLEYNNFDKENDIHYIISFNKNKINKQGMLDILGNMPYFWNAMGIRCVEDSSMITCYAAKLRHGSWSGDKYTQNFPNNELLYCEQLRELFNENDTSSSLVAEKIMQVICNAMSLYPKIMPPINPQTRLDSSNIDNLNSCALY